MHRQISRLISHRTLTSFTPFIERVFPRHPSKPWLRSPQVQQSQSHHCSPDLRNAGIAIPLIQYDRRPLTLRALEREVTLSHRVIQRVARHLLPWKMVSSLARDRVSCFWHRKSRNVVLSLALEVSSREHVERSGRVFSELDQVDLRCGRNFEFTGFAVTETGS